jgi:hypothetical protein
MDVSRAAQFRDMLYHLDLSLATIKHEVGIFIDYNVDVAPVSLNQTARVHIFKAILHDLGGVVQRGQNRGYIAGVLDGMRQAAVSG